MKEFELLHGMLEEQGLNVGDEVECTYSDDPDFHFGCIYLVHKDCDGLYLIDELGYGVSGANELVKFKTIFMKERQPGFQNALEYLGTFGIPAEVTDKGMYIEGELTKVQWLDFAKILLEGEE